MKNKPIEALDVLSNAASEASFVVDVYRDVDECVKTIRKELERAEKMREALRCIAVYDSGDWQWEDGKIMYELAKQALED